MIDAVTVLEKVFGCPVSLYQEPLSLDIVKTKLTRNINNEETKE